MLTLHSSRSHRDCDGHNRRDFLKIGGLGLGGLTLPGLLQARADAAAKGHAVKDTAVVWLWLGGGPTHIETFDPKMTAPSEYRSVTGEVRSKIPEMSFGGHFERMAQLADKLAVIRSFAHNDSGHGSGTHYVMTGYSNRNIDNGGLPSRPAIGSIVSRYRGPNHSKTGMPTYVRLGGIGSDGPAFLGKSYSPFGSDATSRQNMRLNTPLDRLDDRRALLKQFDRYKRDADASGLMDGLKAFEQQAFGLVLGNAPNAFDVQKEDAKTVERYRFDRNGNQSRRGRRGRRPGLSGLGQQLLVARRLCEAGCGFVTVSFGGWDMHGQIKRSLDRRAPEVDHAVSAFIEDVHARGLQKKILLVVTGEFGRTPKVNRNAGRDHWGPLCTLALAGGGLKMGQVVGQSDAKAYRPASPTIKPQDLMATVFDVLGLPQKLQYVDQAGRPVYMIEEGKAIRELV